MTENENTGYAGLYHKLSDLRKDVLSKDWSDDKFFQMGTTGGFKYLSADKIIQTVSPLFMAHGLELRFNITDLQFRPALEKKSQHVTLTMTADIIDIDTGLYTSSTVMAEAADNGDMAVRKAHTVALKQWVLFQFMIADGIDEMAQESTGTGAFRRKTRCQDPCQAQGRGAQGSRTEGDPRRGEEGPCARRIRQEARDFREVQDRCTPAEDDR